MDTPSNDGTITLYGLCSNCGSMTGIVIDPALTKTALREWAAVSCRACKQHAALLLVLPYGVRETYDMGSVHTGFIKEGMEVKK